MQANRRVDTRPERSLRSVLHARGMRFRKDLRVDLRGLRVRVDVAFPRAKVAVFVDGCFWHSCPTHGTQPRANKSFWAAKLKRNVERDRRVDQALAEAGWSVVRVWEHEPPEDAAKDIERIVAASRRSFGLC
jgi:DNA mismatch endonuclease (patch repair protein)